MTIKVYSTPTCPYCDLLKDYLKDNNVEFEVVDLSQDEKAAQYIMEKTGKMAVPVTEIDEEIIVGFDRAKISQVLGIKE
jgi:glutaredoxin 3